MAPTPEHSDYTSIQQRIRQQQNRPVENKVKLMRLTKSQPKHKHGISFSEKDYFELVETTGRIMRENKRGYIDAQLPPILKRLYLEPDGFLKLMKRTDDIAGPNVVGSPTSLSHYIESTGKKLIRGSGLSKLLYT